MTTRDATTNDIAALIDAGKFDAALTRCARVLAANPRDIAALINQGTARLGTGDAAAARRGFNRAIDEDPTVAAAWDGLGKAFYDLGQPPRAAEAFRTAASLSPDPATPRYHRGMALLAAGDFAAGWAEYEYRMPSLKLRRHDKPPWTGDALDGRRLLITAEQGYGDMIQFARFAPLAAARGGAVILEAPAELLPLFAPFADAVTLAATEDGPVPAGAFDRHIHLMSLAGLLGVTADTVPAAVPYIAAPPARIAAWREAMRGDDGVRIGLAWAGRPTHPQDAQRSMDCAHLTPLAALEGLSLYSLQKDQTTATLELAASLAGDFSRRLENFTETAAIVENLDLVITVDTALAHLAGALGKPVWTLLPFAADWRWMRARADTPWYPTMRLFRQDVAGDWAAVVARVCEALAEKPTE